MNFSKIQESKSGDEFSEEDLVFYYDRDERIKNAPKSVQDYYYGNMKPMKPGLFKALVSTKGNRVVFFVLIVCFAVVLAEGVFNKKNEMTFDGVPLTLSAFSFDETVYVSLAFKEIEERPCDKFFSCEISFLDAQKNPVETKKLNHHYDGSPSFLRTTFTDYDIMYVTCNITRSDESAVLEVSVKRT